MFGGLNIRQPELAGKFKFISSFLDFCHYHVELHNINKIVFTVYLTVLVPHLNFQPNESHNCIEILIGKQQAASLTEHLGFRIPLSSMTRLMMFSV